MLKKENSYYILKADAACGRSHYLHYKIGEADKPVRPQDLCSKYTKTTKNLTSKTIQLDYQPLPHNSKKRLNDKTIHKALDKNIFKKVDPNLIKGIYGETDGYDEFFEVLDKSLTDADIVRLVAETVDKLAQDPNNFTAKLTQVNNIVLDYKQQKHLVDDNIVSQLETKFKLDLSKAQGKNILLIGQFLPDWIATFALNNNIVIWHDEKDQIVAYGYEKLNKQIKYINDIEELLDMEIKFDNIIANPPYGSVGANIADTIRQEVDYVEFINLLPANDYKRNTNKDLFNYQSDMVAINKGFADATVTTHCALIHKTKVNNYTEAEFLGTTYLYRSLDKYFMYVADNPVQGYNSGTAPENWTPYNTFVIGQRVIASGNLPKGTNNDAYKWNIEKSLTIEELIKEHNANWYVERNKVRIDLCGLTRTEEEIKNINALVYNNRAFWALVFTSINTDAGVFPLTRVFPEVDYTKIKTVHDLLAACNYTEAEIQEVMNDVENFKHLED